MAATFASRHMDELFTRHSSLVPCGGDIIAAFKLLERAFKAGGTAYFCGNGGSAADAEHWAGELLKGFESKRPVGPLAASLPPEIAQALQGALPAVPLTGFLSLRTAFANDVDPRLDFAQLVWGLGRKGDVLVGLSTSGNAYNVGAAMRVARAKGMATLALTGETGGELRALCDVTIRVPTRRTCHVQEGHLPIYHALCLMLEDAFFQLGDYGPPTSASGLPPGKQGTGRDAGGT